VLMLTVDVLAGCKQVNYEREKCLMSELILPVHLAGTLPRLLEHDQVIAALCRLRDKYPPNSPEHKALNANAETINRLGGRVDSTPIDNISDSRMLASQGYDAASEYLVPKV
jgi:hypothetical protein